MPSILDTAGAEKDRKDGLILELINYNPSEFWACPKLRGPPIFFVFRKIKGRPLRGGCSTP